MHYNEFGSSFLIRIITVSCHGKHPSSSHWGPGYGCRTLNRALWRDRGRWRGLAIQFYLVPSRSCLLCPTPTRRHDVGKDNEGRDREISQPASQPVHAERPRGRCGHGRARRVRVTGRVAVVADGDRATIAPRLGHRDSRGGRAVLCLAPSSRTDKLTCILPATLRTRRQAHALPRLASLLHRFHQGLLNGFGAVRVRRRMGLSFTVSLIMDDICQL